jgi:hypothetical protein
MLMRGKKIKSELEKYKTIFSITAVRGPIGLPKFGRIISRNMADKIAAFLAG